MLLCIPKYSCVVRKCILSWDILVTSWLGTETPPPLHLCAGHQINVIYVEHLLPRNISFLSGANIFWWYINIFFWYLDILGGHLNIFFMISKYFWLISKYFLWRFKFVLLLSKYIWLIFRYFLLISRYFYNLPILWPSVTIRDNGTCHAYSLSSNYFNSRNKTISYLARGK